MGHEGPDAAHFGAELLNEREVGRQPFRRLEGRAHHEASAHGEPGLAQGGQARHAALKRHDRRVQLPVMGGRGRLVAQQVAVGPGGAQALVAFPRALPHRQRDGAARMDRLQRAHHVGQPLVGRRRIFPALQHEGTEARAPARISAGQNLLAGKAIALASAVAAPDTAVVAVVLANVRELDEPASEHAVPVDGLARLPGAPGQLVGQRRGAGINERGVFVRGKAVLARKLRDQCRWLVGHEPLLSVRTCATSQEQGAEQLRAIPAPCPSSLASARSANSPDRCAATRGPYAKAARRSSRRTASQCRGSRGSSATCPQRRADSAPRPASGPVRC